MKLFDDKRVLITGGTGSLGKILVKRLLDGDLGMPSRVLIFSRDEAKQHTLRVEYFNLIATKDPKIRDRFKEVVRFRIGNVRQFESVASALKDIDIVFNAAALKQVPACEEFPFEAIQTNVHAAQNIVQSIKQYNLPVEIVVGISTDKACKPVNVMGMTKAIQERIFVQGNLECKQTRFVCVRYGNVLASRGSVVPLFHQQIQNGGPVTITTTGMTRFLLSLNQAVDTVFAAIEHGRPGETFIPIVPSAKMVDLAEVLIEDRSIKIEVIGIRPGEKTHEIMVSEEEVFRTVQRGEYYAILPNLAELQPDESIHTPLEKEFSSADVLMGKAEIRELLVKNNLMVGDSEEYQAELIR
ncbi:MAG: FlaA1/EpsC-like NDP-sugar epimerase [Cellvibrionaceae bacterium]|jgi:FlaA1/EpsC-like NDP-sugar epimerase